MSRVLDEFEQGLFCNKCNMTTLHLVQKVDEEGNGKYIGYYKECDICSDVDGATEKELGI